MSHALGSKRTAGRPSFALVSVVRARNSFAARGYSTRQKRSRRRTPSSAGVDLRRVEVGRRRSRDCAAHSGGPAVACGGVLGRSSPESRRTPIRARPGDSATRPAMWCMCGPKGATGDGNTEADRFIVRTHATRAFSRLHARSLPSVRPARTPRRPRSGFVLAWPQAIHGVPTPADRPHHPLRLPSTRREWTVPRARSR